MGTDFSPGRVTGVSAVAKPVMDPAVDLTLVRAQRGDRRAQSDLVRRHGPAVHRLIARMMITHPSLVDDLAQDSLLKALRALPRFDPNGPATLSTWILTIATRVAIDALRKTRRREPPPDEPHEEAGPEAVVRAKQLEARVKRAMAELTGDQRAVLVLRAYHDLDYPEIAEALSIELGTVKSRLSRARRALREALHGE